MSCIVAIVDEKQKMMVISTDIAWNRMVPSPIGLGRASCDAHTYTHTHPQHTRSDRTFMKKKISTSASEATTTNATVDQSCISPASCTARRTRRCLIDVKDADSIR